MLSEGIRPIGDGLLEVAAERLQGLLVADDINEIYDVEQTPFARGKFAAVRRAIHKKTGVHYAAKFLRRRRRAQCTLKEIGHEIAILMLCADSKHIVKLNAVHETKAETALLLDLATGGELQAILDEEGALTEAQAKICMREILRALQYLHKKCIAHLDLKPQNILMCGEKVEDGLKLCDFGISRMVEEGGKVREILGTPDYVAPEVLQYEPLSLKTDIWSVGVLAYVLLTGMSPFGGDTKQETFLNISKCLLDFPDELFEDVSPMAIDFIKSTLRVKPNDRMTASECLEHRWLCDDNPSVTVMTPSATTPMTNCLNFFENPITPLVHHAGTVRKQSIDTKSDESTERTISLQSLSKDFSNNKENILAKSNRMVPQQQQQQQPQQQQHTVVVTLTSTTTSTLTSTSQVLQHPSNLFLLDDIISEELINSATNGGNTCDRNVDSNHIKQQQQQQISVSTASISLFPDAPTTPKVCRKSSPDSPPSVKALVKKFQLESSANESQQVTTTNPTTTTAAASAATAATVTVVNASTTTTTTALRSSSNGTSGTNGTNGINGIIDIDTSNGPSTGGSNIQDDHYCTARCAAMNCTPCGGSTGCRHLNGNRKPLVLDQGIIC